MNTLPTYTPKFKEFLSKLKAKIRAGEDQETVKKFFVNSLKDLGHIERVQNLYRIRDKHSSKLIQFKPTTEQLRFLNTKRGKDIILKARQLGFTTLSCICYYDRALWDGWTTGIMAHKQERVKIIFKMVKTANECFKKDWGQFYSPEEESDNTTVLSWKDLKSSVTVAFDFQGLTVQALHASEAAFIEGARLTNSLQAVPDSGEIILESTPNGRGGFFYDVWQDWKENGGGAPFKGHFYRWFDHYPEFPERYAPTEELLLTPEEQELINEHNLKDFHIVWRRYKIRESCGGSSETFDIQYPADDVSCFLSGELPVFNKNILTYQSKFAQAPRYVGNCKINGKKIDFYEEKKGLINIYKLPEAHGQYALGADPSGGTGGDPGSICVLDYKNCEQVASLTGFLDPDLFADELYKLGQFYNHGYICIEANNHGAAVILKLKNIYPHLYKRQEFNAVTKQVGKQFGFMTTSSNKIAITDHAVAMLRDGKAIVREKELIDELSNFANVQRKAADGRMISTMRREARAGRHDDRVMALCLALEMVRTKPANYTKINTERTRLRYTDRETGFLHAPSGYDFTL